MPSTGNSGRWALPMAWSLQADSSVDGLPGLVYIFLNKTMSLSRPLSVVAIAAVLGLTACSEAVDTHPAQLVTKRRALFKQFTRTLEPMGMVASGNKEYKPRAFRDSAMALEQLASQPWGYFTPDSNYPPTHAMPAVWKQAPEFKQAQENFLAKVGLLMKAADGGDLDVIRTAVTEVQYSCKTCHNQFRKDY